MRLSPGMPLVFTQGENVICPLTFAPAYTYKCQFPADS